MFFTHTVRYESARSAKTSLPHSDGAVVLPLHPSDKGSSRAQALGLQVEPFSSTPPAIASVFSKAVRKRPSAELSGSEPFLPVVAPLTAAIRHEQEQKFSLDSFEHLDAELLLALYVIDSALALIDVATATEPRSVPWIRVIRSDVDLEAHPCHRVRPNLIDFIHVGYLDQHLANHLLPFARPFARRCRRSALPLATGRGPWMPEPEVSSAGTTYGQRLRAVSPRTLNLWVHWRTMANARVPARQRPALRR